MLALAVDFPELTIFFNGARCGASAPDHMHFQAGSRLFMPIEQQWQERIGEHLAVVGQARLHIMENDPRNTLVMISNKAVDAVKLFEKILWALSWVQTTSLNDIQSMREGEICGECLPQTWKLKGVELPQSGRIIEQNKLSAVLCNEGSESQEEPNVNVLCYYENRQWFTFIFPRTRHRPSCYFSEGDEQMIISPASVDLGGVFITVRESDFKHLDATRLENILHEVCWQEQEIKVFKDSLKSNGTTK